MSRLTWGDPGKRFYETGVDRGVLYLAGADGVPWNGLTLVNHRPSGGEPQAYYIDGVKYQNFATAEEWAGTIQAYTYPDEFAECDGTARVHSGLFVTQQQRKPFGFSYRTMVGNDMSPNHGYKIHLVYNALAAPSDVSYNTLSNDVEALDFSWEVTALPPAMTGVKPTAHLMVDTRSSNPAAIIDVENILYGTDEEAARLPTLAELIDVFEAYAILSVTDNEDGTFTISGPDEAIVELTPSTYQISWPSVVAIDEDTYSISSL